MSPPLPPIPGSSQHFVGSDKRENGPSFDRRSVSRETEVLVPFSEEPAGSIDFQGHDITAWSLACRSTGEVICLNCTGIQEGVSAAFQRLIKQKGRILPFHPFHPAFWFGPTDLIRLEERYLLLQRPLAGTHLKNYCLVARSANIIEGIKRIRALPPGLAASDEASDGPSSRFVLGAAGAVSPPPGAAFGHWEGMQVVCLPEWERTLWSLGMRAGLVTPLPAFGISCWELDGDASRWRQLVKRGITEQVLPLPLKNT